MHNSASVGNREGFITHISLLSPKDNNTLQTSLFELINTDDAADAGEDEDDVLLRVDVEPPTSPNQKSPFFENVSSPIESTTSITSQNNDMDSSQPSFASLDTTTISSNNNNSKQFNRNENADNDDGDVNALKTQTLVKRSPPKKPKSKKRVDPPTSRSSKFIAQDEGEEEEDKEGANEMIQELKIVDRSRVENI